MATLDGWRFGVTLVAALGSGLIAGVFFAFSTFVMKALAQRPASEGIAAMQAISEDVINPWFMGLSWGTGAACLLWRLTRCSAGSIRARDTDLPGARSTSPALWGCAAVQRAEEQRPGCGGAAILTARARGPPTLPAGRHGTTSGRRRRWRPRRRSPSRSLGDRTPSTGRAGPAAACSDGQPRGCPTTAAPPPGSPAELSATARRGLPLRGVEVGMAEPNNHNAISLTEASTLGHDRRDLLDPARGVGAGGRRALIRAASKKWLPSDVDPRPARSTG